MKKLLALLVVAGMVFVACNNTNEVEEVTEEAVVDGVEETVVESPEIEAVEMPAEEAVETTEEVAE